MLTATSTTPSAIETFRAAGIRVLGSRATSDRAGRTYDTTPSEQRGAADPVRHGVSDPTVYLLESDDAATSAVVSTATTPPAAQQPVAASTPVATPAPAQPAATPSSTPTSGDRYLQVGAYGSRDSSLPQRDRLEGLGFVVSERLESDMVKLLIGPFDNTGLVNAQGRLQAAGIESFPPDAERHT